MPKPAQSRFWPLARRLFRWFRICCLLLVLAVVCGVIYLNQVGLPGFVKDRLLAELRSRGIELEFARMRLHWYRGIVAEKVNLGRAKEPLGPQLFVEEVTLKLNEPALRDFRFEVDSLVLRQGRMVWPLAAANEPPYRLAVDDLQTELRFLPGDQWELAELQGRCLGVKLNLAGTITNAAHLRQWQWRRATNQPPSVWPRQLQQVARTLERIHFTAAPEMFLTLHLDARNTNQFAADLRLQAVGARTPWGTVDNVLLSAPLRPAPGSNGLVQADFRFKCDQATTPWGETKQARLNLRLVQSLTNPLPLSADLDLNLRQPKSRWASARNLTLVTHTTNDAKTAAALRTQLKLTAQGFTSKWAEAEAATLAGLVEHSPTNVVPGKTALTLSLVTLATQWGKAGTADLDFRTAHTATNWVPLTADGTLKLVGADTRWGKAASLDLTGRFAPAATREATKAGADWAWWAKLAPYLFDWDAQLTGVQSPKIELPRLSLAGRWSAPELSLTRLDAALFDGTLQSAGSLNIATREARLSGGIDFDPHRIGPWLSVSGQRQLNQLAWDKPPLIKVSAAVVLPATVWTNARVDWQREVLPKLTLAGNIQTGRGAFRDVPYLAVQTDLTLTNALLRLPNLVIDRPEGRAALEYSANVLASDYYLRFDSHLDPKAIRPLLADEAGRKVLDYFEFTETPSLLGEIRGRWNAAELTDGHARLAFTNFTFRGAAWSSFTAWARYTNQVIQATNVLLLAGPQKLALEQVRVDIPADRITITNGFSTMDPLLVTGVIGPKTREAIEPYRFAKPPTVSFFGSLPLADEERTDLHFDIAGGPFNYWKFNLPQIRGWAHWVTNALVLTNVQGQFYGGELRGDAFFDFSPKVGTDFRFQAVPEKVNFHQFMSDMLSPTNTLEGVLGGTLNVTRANSSDWGSWQGNGTAALQDGFLWDIPLVGMFSPVLNAVAPGLGKSRVNEGKATYVITNSVIYTKDLVLRAPAMRLKYDGTVDFDANVNARVEAELFRDAWLVGPLVRLALMPLSKIFEYKVTGTLGDPKKSPLYIPKLLLLPFQPFRTLKELLPSGPPTPKPAAPSDAKPATPPAAPK